MIDIIKSELKRYQTLALIAFVGQIFLWIMIAKFTVILAPGAMKHGFLMIISAAGGFGFALISMGLHKRKNHWTYLVHRPLSVKKIHTALSIASLLIIFLSFVLPFTAITLYLDILTNNIVELRHYLYCLHMMAVASIAYFIGSFVILTPSKGAILSAWILSYLILRTQTPVSSDLLIDLVFALITFYIARQAFKVNLDEFSDNKVNIVLSAFVLQPAILFLLVTLQTVYYHMPLMVIGEHPSKQKEAVNYTNFIAKDIVAQYTMVVNGTEHQSKDAFLRQLSLSEFKNIRGAKFQAPYVQQLFAKDRSFSLSDIDKNDFWIFSHSKMVFIGRDIKSDKIVGYLGINGFLVDEDEISQSDRFASIPMVDGNKTIQTNSKIYFVDFKQQTINLKHQLAEGESYLSSPRMMFDMVVVKTSHSILFFDQIDFLDETKLVKNLFTVKHPIDYRQAFQFEITEVLNGYLILYRSFDYFGFNNPGSSVSFLDRDGMVESIASYVFEERNLPEFIFYQKFILSPLFMMMVGSEFKSSIDYGTSAPEKYRNLSDQRYSLTLFIACVILALISSLTTFLVSRRMQMKPSLVTLWTTMNLFLSLPGLVSFLLLNHWQQHTNLASARKEQEAL